MTLLSTYHQHGEQKHATLGLLKELIEHPGKVAGSLNARHWSQRMATMLCMQTTDTSIELYWHDGILRSRHGSGTAPSVHIPVVEEFSDRLAKKMDADQHALAFEALDRTASAHFIGGMPIADNADGGGVDPYQRAFGQPGLDVMDGGVMPANPGVNPSLLITALAERAMSLWPNKGDTDARPPLGGLRPRGPGHAAPAHRPGRSARRASPRRQGRRHHPRIPLLSGRTPLPEERTT